MSLTPIQMQKTYIYTHTPSLTPTPAPIPAHIYTFTDNLILNDIILWDPICHLVNVWNILSLNRPWCLVISYLSQYLRGKLKYNKNLPLKGAEIFCERLAMGCHVWLHISPIHTIYVIDPHSNAKDIHIYTYSLTHTHTRTHTRPYLHIYR